MAAIEEALRSRRRTVLLAIVAGSVLVRIAYFVALSRGPCLSEHRWPQWDMEFFQRWAQAIASGDWLTAQPLHPFHPWHEDVAAAYLEGLPADTPQESPAEVWNRWYGGTRFHQEPLYPYLMGITYFFLGADPRWIFAWQMLAGIGSNVLVYLLARRCFGDVVGTLAGALAVLFAPALYYELILLRTALTGFLSLAIALAVLRALEGDSPRRWLLTGILSGLGILLQSFLGLLPAGAAAFLALERRRRRGLVLTCLGALAAGVALPLLPLLARNLAVGAPPLGLTSVGAVTFVCSNAADIDPGAGFVVSRYTARVMAASEGRLGRAVVDTLRTHPSAWSVLRLLARKLAALTHWYEIPNNTNFYFFRLHAGVLRLLPVTFTLVGPLGLLGLVVAVPEFRRCRVLYLLAAVCAAPMLAFYVLSRFRAPFALALLPFAALAIVRTFGWLRTGRLAVGLASTAAALCLAAWTSRPLPPGRPLIRTQDHSVTYEIYYERLADEAEERGDACGVADVLGEFLRLTPGTVTRLSPLDPPRTRSEALFAGWYGAIHRRRADALRRCGRTQEAAEEQGRADVLDALYAAGAAP